MPRICGKNKISDDLTLRTERENENMVKSFIPRGICARRIEVEIEDGIIKDVEFYGGCDGNHKGITALCIGRPVEEVANLLSGITCGFKPTSCPDQLSRALREYMDEQ